jgi:NAD-dependent SIR2 family protein deacetylase
MEFAGNISDLLRNEQDRINYNSLIKLIQDSASSETHLSAFVGAGLSIQAGYPSSNDLIKHLIDEAKLEPAELNSLTTFALKAQRIKEFIQEKGGNFYEILYRRFDEDHFPINRTIPLYQDLLRIPFGSIITTNYDKCIEEAADFLSIQFDEIQVYPILRANDLRANNLYHIHGRIDHADIPKSAETIVLTSDDYENAYGDSSMLPVLMNAIFDSHNIVFIGFSLEEDALYELLELSRKRSESIKKYKRFNPYKFAILPFERRKLDPFKVNGDEIEMYKVAITKQDQDLLNNYGVITIRYYANEIYSEIKKIVRDINISTRVKTTKVELDLVNTEVST